MGSTTTMFFLFLSSWLKLPSSLSTHVQVRSPCPHLPLVRIRSFRLHQAVFSSSSIPSRGEGSSASVSSLTLSAMGHSPRILTAKQPCRVQTYSVGWFLKTNASRQEARCTWTSFSEDKNDHKSEAGRDAESLHEPDLASLLWLRLKSKTCPLHWSPSGWPQVDVGCC